MAEKILNFEKVEFTAANLDEAKSFAPFGIQGNATQAYKKWLSEQTGIVTESAKKQFFLDYLKKKTKNVEGSGYIIVEESAIVDKRERPYKKINVKNENGKREWVTNFDIVGKASNKVYATVTLDDAKKFAKVTVKNDGENNEAEKEIRVKKADADKVAKKLFADGVIKEDVIILYKKVTRNPEQAIAAVYEYTPSKNTRPGKYIAFGIKA